MVGDGVNQLFVSPAQVMSSVEFTQAVIHVSDMRAAVEEPGVAAWSSRSTTRQRREPTTALLGCREEARRRGSRTPKATWSGLFRPDKNQPRRTLAQVVMKSIMIADKLRESQAYGQQRIAELGIEPAEVPARVQEFLKGSAKDRK